MYHIRDDGRRRAFMNALLPGILTMPYQPALIALYLAQTHCSMPRPKIGGYLSVWLFLEGGRPLSYLPPYLLLLGSLGSGQLCPSPYFFYPELSLLLPLLMISRCPIIWFSRLPAWCPCELLIQDMVWSISLFYRHVSQHFFLYAF